MVRTRETKYMVRLENVISIRARLREASNLQSDKSQVSNSPAGLAASDLHSPMTIAEK